VLKEPSTQADLLSDPSLRDRLRDCSSNLVAQKERRSSAPN
jgi:hypothetical protein